MKNLFPLFCRSILLLATIVGLRVPPLSATTPPGISVLDRIDLSPGRDVYEPLWFAGNDTTHELYVIGSDPDAGGIDPFSSNPPTFGVKVINTATNQATAGVDLGVYHLTPYSQPFTPEAIAVDSSSSPEGNKAYVLGFADYTYLRIIDGATKTNLTGQGSDLLLPDDGEEIAVNPNNHKIYITNFDGKVTIVDGVTRQITKAFNTPVGLYSHTLVVNSQTNAVFVFGGQASIIIDGETDTFTSFTPPYSTRTAVFDPGTGNIFALSYDGILNRIDAETGDLIESQPDIPENPVSLAVDPSAGLVYVGQSVDSSYDTTGEIRTFRTDTLIDTATRYQVGAAQLAFMASGNSAGLCFLNYDTYRRQGTAEYRNTLGVLNPTSGLITKITVGYSPAALAVNPVTNRIYVTDFFAPELVVLEGATHSVLDRVAVPPAASSNPFGLTEVPRSIAVSADDNRIYLSHTTTNDATGIVTMSLDVYDGATDQVVNTLVVNADTAMVYPRVAIDDTRQLLYVTNYSSTASPQRSVKVYDLKTAAFLTTIPLSDYRDIALNPVTGHGYVPSYNRTVEIVTPGSADVLSVPISGSYNNLGPLTTNPVTNRIFTVESGGSGNGVAVIDGNSAEMETTIPNQGSHKGDAVTDVAVDPLTNTIFLADDTNRQEENGWIEVYDGANDYSYLGEIAVGRYPERIAFNPASRQLLVPSSQDGMIDVLQSNVPAPPDALGNISTRLGVQTEDNVLIGGLIITGPAGSTKQVLIRGIGPSLADFGLTGALPDPFLELHSGSSTIAVNDNWRTSEDGDSQQAAIEATNLAPSNNLESAILMELAPGSYTAVLRGTNGGTGIGLVEAYDLSPDAATKMVNISTRGRVDTGDNVMIGGIIVSGVSPSHLVVRAIGPSLTQFGVTGALADPTLELYNNQGVLITSNDDWKDENEDALAATGLAPGDDRESAILTTLYPSSYTAIVRGKDDTTGVGLVEAYYLP